MIIAFASYDALCSVYAYACHKRAWLQLAALHHVVGMGTCCAWREGAAKQGCLVLRLCAAQAQSGAPLAKLAV